MLEEVEKNSLEQEHKMAQAQAQALELEQNAQPMIGVVETCDNLVPLYQNNPQQGRFLDGIHSLSKTFSGMRRVRGDGNCFYRAFLFSYLENIISRLPSSGAELERFKRVIVGSKSELVAVGYDEFAFETFYDMILELLEKVAVGGEQAASNLLDAFQEESGESDYYVWYMRLVTACALKRDAERFQPFIPDSSCADIGEFCARCVEPMKTECEHLQILALTEFLGVEVHIHYLPCPEGEPMVVHKFQERDPGSTSEGNGFFVSLLYRPGHFDVLIL